MIPGADVYWKKVDGGNGEEDLIRRVEEEIKSEDMKEFKGTWRT